jgi:hypothetical protein
MNYVAQASILVDDDSDTSSAYTRVTDHNKVREKYACGILLFTKLECTPACALAAVVRDILQST